MKSERRNRSLPKLKLPRPSGSAIKAAFQTRSFRVGGYSVAAVLMVIAIAVAANLFVNALPVSLTQIDTTSSGVFSISQQTEEILSGLEQEVTVYWVVQNGQEDSRLETLLKRYEAMSDQIKLVKKDPDVYPAFVQQYVSEGLSNNSLIVESDQRNTTVSYGDMYEYDYSNYYTTGSYDTSFTGESVLTSAIDYVVREELPKIYTLTGHGEATLSTDFRSAVEQENVELEELSLLTVEEVPEDADCILIYGPEKDISQEELELLQSYLQGGGNLILLTDAPEDGTERSNLEALMADYGVNAQEGIVIEGNQSNYALGMPYYLLPNIQSHTITDPLTEGGYYVLLSIGQGLNVDENLEEDVTVTKLLTTSDDSYSTSASYQMKEEGGTDGPFALAVAITKAIDEDTESNIVWVSSTSLLDDETNARVAGGNQDFFLNAIGWMCGEESNISIHAKSVGYQYLTMDSRTASLLTTLMVAALPIGYLAAGIVVWSRRRRG